MKKKKAEEMMTRTWEGGKGKKGKEGREASMTRKNFRQINACL